MYLLDFVTARLTSRYRFSVTLNLVTVRYTVNTGAVPFLNLYPCRFGMLLSYDLLLTAGTRWLSWLRHCATNQEVAGSSPDGALGFFSDLIIPAGRNMVWSRTQPLTEMSTRDISWGGRRPVRRADNHATFVCRLSRNCGILILILEP